MKCIYPEKQCPYRRKVKTEESGEFENCFWTCPLDAPDRGCEVARAGWGCFWSCVYDALEPKNPCQRKDELRKNLESKLLVNDEFEKEKRLIATCAGYCRLLQVQILRTKNRGEMFKIQKEHAENCPQCKGNLYVLGSETGGRT